MGTSFPLCLFPWLTRATQRITTPSRPCWTPSGMMSTAGRSTETSQWWHSRRVSKAVIPSFPAIFAFGTAGTPTKTKRRKFARSLFGNSFQRFCHKGGGLVQHRDYLSRCLTFHDINLVHKEHWKTASSRNVMRYQRSATGEFKREKQQDVVHVLTHIEALLLLRW